MTSAGLVNGLCIGYAILSVLSLIVMSLAANLHRSVSLGYPHSTAHPLTPSHLVATHSLHSGVKVTYSGYTSYSYTIAGGALGWEIFNGLQGWLFAGVLAAMWGYKPAYDGIMKIWGKTSPVTIQWVWLAINAVECGYSAPGEGRRNEI